MKVYMFYLVHEFLTETYFPGISNDNVKRNGDTFYALYGFTNDKSIRNKFINTRNMDIFYYKTEDMSKDEYESFSEKYDDYVIKFRGYKTKSIKNDKIVTDIILILSTGKEFNKVYFDGISSLHLIFDEVHKNLSLISPDIFNDTISNILKRIFNYYDFIDWVRQMDSMPFYSFEINLFALYFHEFENTYNIERMCDACIYGDTLKNLLMQN